MHALDWIRQIVERLGYWGIAALTFLENIIPPIPSEVVMPLAGVVSSQGDIHPVGAIIAGSVGSLAGTSLYYFAGRAAGAPRIRKWIQAHPRLSPLHESEFDKAMDWFAARGRWALLVGRFVPGIRTFISLPAGLCGTSFAVYLAYSSVGVLTWTAALTYAGVALGENYHRVEQYLGPVSYAVVAAILIAVAVHRLRSKPR